MELESLNLEAGYSEETNELTVTSSHSSQHDDINVSKADESIQIIRAELDDEEHKNNSTSSQETSSTFGSGVQPIYAQQDDNEGIDESGYVDSRGHALNENWLETERDAYANACQKNTASHGQEARSTFQSYDQAYDSGTNEFGEVSASTFISTWEMSKLPLEILNWHWSHTKILLQ